MKINRVGLGKKSRNDKIGSFNTTDLGLIKPAQGSVFEITLYSPSKRLSKHQFVSTKADGSVLTIPFDDLPRFVTLPRLNKKTGLNVIAIKQVR